MWLKPLAAVGAGFLGDKIGISRTIAWSFAVLIVSFGLFVFTPGNPSLVLILVVNTAVDSTAVFVLRDGMTTNQEEEFKQLGFGQILAHQAPAA